MGDPMNLSVKRLGRFQQAWNYLSTLLPGSADKDGNRYAKDWNMYSRRWDLNYSAQYANLGDEWNDDRTEDRKRDAFYFTAYAERWINHDSTVLEVGPGGGKWTTRISPMAKRVIVLDVAEEMLKRTKARCDAAGLTNVEFLLGDGKDFQPLTDGCVDFFFSYDVFVHIALEDTWPYAQEIARVLKPGGRGACHYAVNSISDAWDRIEQNNHWYRGGQHTLGQYYYFSPETLRRMYERCGLGILEQHQEGWHCTCIFEKPAASIVPDLELLLKRLMSVDADDMQMRSGIVRALRALPGQLEERMAPLLTEVIDLQDSKKRSVYAAEIRRLWRGV
jgi:ubiquinone/menaquinone biosynthesis C-methylase UbiE